MVEVNNNELFKQRDSWFLIDSENDVSSWFVFVLFASSVGVLVADEDIFDMLYELSLFLLFIVKYWVGLK